MPSPRRFGCSSASPRAQVFNWTRTWTVEERSLHLGEVQGSTAPPKRGGQVGLVQGTRTGPHPRAIALFRLMGGIGSDVIVSGVEG